MTHRLTTLLSLTATPQDGRFGVSEVFHDRDTWRLRRVALDAGGWFERREVLIRIERFGRPGESEWPVDMSRDEVEQAPRWNDAPDPSTALPPVVVGPFGHTFSPLLMAARWTDAEDRALRDEGFQEPGAGSAAPEFDMDQASAWLGRDVFDDTGHVGTIADITVGEDWVMREMLLKDDRAISMSRLRRVGEQGHVVID